MKRSPHPCGQRGSREGGEKNPPGRPNPLIPLQSRTQNPRYASNARHTPASGHAGPLRAPTPLSRAHTHAHARAPAHTHGTRTHPPRPPPRSGDPPTFFPPPGLLSSCWVFFFYSRAGGEGGYNGGDTMRGKQYGKNKYFLECKFNLCSSLKFC